MIELNINSRKLLHALTLVGRVVPSNPMAPILENVKAVISGTEARFIADNFKQNIVVTAQCGSIGTDGEFLIPYKKITELLKTLPDLALNITHTRSGTSCSLVINAEGKKFKLSAEPVEDFPKDKVFIGKSITLPGDQIKEAINLCLGTVESNEIKPAMCGIYFNTESGEIVSTNGMNMTVYQLDSSIDASPFIITSSFAKMVHDLITKDQETVTLEVSTTSVRVSSDDQVITASQIDEKFPNYSSAIPESCKMEGEINVDDWNVILKRSALFSGTKAGMSINTFKAGELTVTSEDKDYGNDSVQEMRYDGDIDIEIGLSGKALPDILKLYSGNAKIGLTAANRALMIYPENTMAKKLTILSMPLMLPTVV